MEKVIDYSEVSRCHVCTFPKCTEACPHGIDPGRILRALVFDNTEGASHILAGTNAGQMPCLKCPAPCEKACILGVTSHPVSIKQILSSIKSIEVRKNSEPDISCDICGVKLENPFLLSSSVVASTYDMCARAFEAGWAGVAFKTICFFPQHETSPRFSALKTQSNAFSGFKNIEQLSDHSVRENMEIFYKLRDKYPSKVIVASIMGQNEQEWQELARFCELSGASVIECNFSCPNMEDRGLGITIGQSAKLVERFTAAARRGTKLPLLAKLTPNITDMVPIAIAAKRGGADGIAAINTINSITGVNIDSFVAEPAVRGKSIIGGYSGRAVKPIALRFISDLGHSEFLNGMHISGMGGITTWKDALDYLLLGAQSLQVTTAVMEYGYRIIDDLTDGLKNYLVSHNLHSLKPIIGAACKTIVEHTEIERDTILLPKFNYNLCRGCGRCYTSCMDGGHQAIAFDSITRKPILDAKKCVGCHLCKIVCPFNAIDAAAHVLSADRNKTTNGSESIIEKFGEFYNADTNFRIINVPRMKCVAFRGTGDIAEKDEEIADGMKILFSIISTIKLSREKGYYIEGFEDFDLFPPEAIIWKGDSDNADSGKWICLFKVPDFVTRNDFDWAVNIISSTRSEDCSLAEFLTINEGTCVQVLHSGPYEEIIELFPKIDNFLEQEGYERDTSYGKVHHEIHLSNLTKLQTNEKLTIVRLPVRKKK